MKDLSSSVWEQLEKIILDIHTETDVPKLQLNFLTKLEALVPSTCSFFDLCRQKDGHLFFFDPVALHMSAADLAAYYREFQFSDYVAWSFAADKPIVYRDSDMISSPARENSDIYKRWMEPMGIYHSIGCTVMGYSMLFGSVTLFRSREEGDFSSREVEILTVLNRHLSAHFSLLWSQGAPATNGQRMSALAEWGALSSREREVMSLIAAGNSNTQIAQQLFVTESTVKKHTNSLYRKLKVTSRTQLLKLFYSERT